MQTDNRRESDSGRDLAKEEDERGVFHNIKQQMMKAWLPVPSLTKTIVLFFGMSIVFLGIGIPMIILTNNIVQVKVNYDDTCISSANNCVVSFTIPYTMQAPVFVYY